MILEVQHETRLEYSDAVTESLTEVRMEPGSDADQSCRSFHLMVSPLTQLFRYQDGFGNRVHHFNVLTGHGEVRILAASLVETHRRQQELDSCRAVYPLDREIADLDALDYLKFRGPVRSTAQLAPILETLQPRAGISLAELARQVAHYIHSHFEYARDVTLSTSPIDDVLEQGKGVCQDFTHLMIAILRSFGIPARYVSGYLHRPNKESQSHAWCEVWLPDLGWVGMDPTNDLVVNDHFVKVAVGRDFSDIPPNKGVYRGQAEEKISVRVETRALERLPSLTWQDELPPLQVPLTAIVSRALRQAHPDEELPQQQ
jgi:transglutaminase-like putative cysteine protease